jgi:uncharacterized protein YbjT (DUF2867 family)
MQEVITVTGGTGTIRGELVRLLSAAGAPTRAVFRDERRTHDLPGVVWLRADLRDPRVLVPALAGTRRLFLLSGNQSGFGRMQIEVVRAARDLGVEHVVKLSALGASDHSRSSIAREHWEVEQVLQQSPMTWTILRPHAFMQNWLGDVAESIRLEGVIRSPIGDARVPFIDTRDIAAVAAETLLHPEAHAGRRYFLTGGEAVGYADVAAAISRATGQPVAYRPISMEEARAEMEARGVPHDLMDAMLAIYTYQKAGGPTSQVSDGVRRVLGRPPRSVADFARDHASHFRPARDTAAHANPSDDQLRAILASARTIAVVGASSKPGRPSNSVMRILLAAGYHVIPATPERRRCSASGRTRRSTRSRKRWTSSTSSAVRSMPPPSPRRPCGREPAPSGSSSASPTRRPLHAPRRAG